MEPITDNARCSDSTRPSTSCGRVGAPSPPRILEDSYQ